MSTSACLHFPFCTILFSSLGIHSFTLIARVYLREIRELSLCYSFTPVVHFGTHSQYLACCERTAYTCDFVIQAERASLRILSLGLIPVSSPIIGLKIKLTITNIPVLLCFVLKGPPKIYALKGWSSWMRWTL